MVPWGTRKPTETDKVLAYEYGSYLLYDVEATRKIATDVWGVKPEDVENAIEQDYQHLKAYCDGDWHYVGVKVSPHAPEESCWGVEATDTEWVIAELVQELEAQNA